MQITAKKSDFIWNYLGLFFRMAGAFLLLPLVLSMLDDRLVGLWYVFQAVNSFIAVFQAGFAPTFARHFAYCWSGSKSFKKQGAAHVEEAVDYSAFRTLIAACKVVYKRIALTTALAMATIGSVYTHSVAIGMPMSEWLPAWVIFVAAVFLNIYFDYFESMLRGVGDFTGINKATIGASVSQLVIMAVLLLAGFGIMSCSIGFLVQGVAFRLLCSGYFSKHVEIKDGLVSAGRPLKAQVEEVRKEISGNAYRDTLVSVANYLSTTANTLLCASFVGLAESSAFSIALQLLNACVNVSSVALSTYQPALQSAYANGDVRLERKLTSRVLVSFMGLYAICVVGLFTVGIPLLSMLGKASAFNYGVTAVLAIYMFLWKQHSVCATLIANTNKIPYTKAFVMSSLVGIILSLFFLQMLNGSIYGLIAGQFIAQAVYNNWKWPQEAAHRLKVTFFGLLNNGFCEIATAVEERLSPIRKGGN